MLAGRLHQMQFILVTFLVYTESFMHFFRTSRGEADIYQFTFANTDVSVQPDIDLIYLPADNNEYGPCSEVPVVSESSLSSTWFPKLRLHRAQLRCSQNCQCDMHIQKSS